jgi:hypothetical protein
MKPNAGPQGHEGGEGRRITRRKVFRKGFRERGTRKFERRAGGPTARRGHVYAEGCEREKILKKQNPPVMNSLRGIFMIFRVIRMPRAGFAASEWRGFCIPEFSDLPHHW